MESFCPSMFNTTSLVLKQCDTEYDGCEAVVPHPEHSGACLISGSIRLLMYFSDTMTDLVVQMNIAP